MWWPTPLYECFRLTKRSVYEGTLESLDERCKVERNCHDYTV